MSKKIKILFCPVDSEPKFMEIKPNLESYYKLIGCDFIDIKPIFHTGLCLVIDDEGRLKDGARTNPNFYMLLSEIFGLGVCGGYFFANTNEDGDIVSLTDEQIIELGDAVRAEQNEYIKKIVAFGIDLEEACIEANPDLLSPKIYPL